MRHLLVAYHSCPYEPPGAGLSGGMNVFLSGLLPALSALGVETDVLTRGLGDAPSVTRPAPGVRVFHLPCGPGAGAWSREAAWRALPRFVAGVRAFFGTAPRRYGAASAHYWMSALALRAALGAPERSPASLPVAFMYHTVEERKPRTGGGSGDALSRLRMAAERGIPESVDALVCLSAEDLAGTVERFPAAAPRGIVIPPGIDARFAAAPSREEARRALGISPDAVVFLLAARADAGKNVPEAAGALRRLRDALGVPGAVLRVVGQGASPGSAGTEGVWFEGAVPHAEMPARYAAADAVVCPSRYESFGLVPLEAMACGTPPVVPGTVRWGRLAESEGGALAYDPDDPGALAGAMARIARDPALRGRLAEEGRRIASGFTWPRCAASWTGLLSRLSTPGGRPGTPRAPGARRRR